MGNACTVCNHPDRAAIDEALVSAPSKRGIARRFGVSDDALNRHKAAHLSKTLISIHKRREERQAVTLLDRVDDMVARVEGMVASAEAGKNAKAFLDAAKELRGWLRLYGEVTGELDSTPQVQVLNVTQSADWQMLSAVIEQALAPYPEARLAVVEGVQRAIAARQTAEEAG